ncbi:RNA methyltransferase [Desulforhopalus singaporensis]|uniref:tRNA (guanine-N(1)-)-methyltransferase C-terminal domain-containing protein n=1 Tax=Desulforhopalus singaporensis TaxID=91360 RepID=A0A1H0MIH2_9BACT|nr:RNA methyltransferase [Desulforhopalus singaporensis]SDO80115.1 hypothetical protein SAMN05660330_01061 [Desulforhopalus singaporensis]
MNSRVNVHLALIHHPVMNKNRETIGSAVTNLDIHDIARMARTYGVLNYFIATPYSDQHQLVEEILQHWRDGHGARYNPARKEALAIVKLANSLAEIRETVAAQYGKSPLVVTTSALEQKNNVSYAELRDRIADGEHILLLFGTAHGLAPEIMKQADIGLPPIKGGTDYNHLSVRSASSIILDRLLGS